MEIATSGNTVTIKGNIKSVNDFQSIKTTLDSLSVSSKVIQVRLVDSISITSSVIGYFNKLVLRDKIDLSLHVGNAQLMDLLEDLNLSKVLKAQKI
ncbi:hypothetical protein JHD48_04930 [Sulfurimonas sp. SAG-AH-194-I05]|nr:hypothetical protein [Sulfurimonas sp. SAG-AH-194-I05]MDF1875074.1 hypothetical protein [Sulfurimonas sp. SAG-AH-194-I05]